MNGDPKTIALNLAQKNFQRIYEAAARGMRSMTAPRMVTLVSAGIANVDRKFWALTEGLKAAGRSMRRERTGDGQDIAPQGWFLARQVYLDSRIFS